MIGRRLLVLVALGAALAIAPAAFADDDDGPRRGPFHQDPGNVDFPETGGWPACWDCVISLSEGYKCETQYNGYRGCQAGMTFTHNSIGVPVVTPFCTVVPFNACFTVTP